MNSHDLSWLIMIWRYSWFTDDLQFFKALMWHSCFRCLHLSAVSTWNGCLWKLVPCDPNYHTSRKKWHLNRLFRFQSQVLHVDFANIGCQKQRSVQDKTCGNSSPVPVALILHMCCESIHLWIFALKVKPLYLCHQRIVSMSPWAAKIRRSSRMPRQMSWTWCRRSVTWLVKSSRWKRRYQKHQKKNIAGGFRSLSWVHKFQAASLQ